jgi:pyrimidine oxygenase
MGSDDFQKTVEVGVFLPVGNDGWIWSRNVPDTPGTYDHNKEVALLAEELGFDIAFSMMTWDGHQGETRHWSRILESMTMMAGLAEATSRIEVWGTAQVLQWHPVVAAKMIATIDEISGGRAGLNVVTGDAPLSLPQLDQFTPDESDGKYGLAPEWVQVVRKYWTNDKIEHDGKYFHAGGAWASPKPSKMPRIVCAGQSPAGLKFTAENCDCAFFTGSDNAMAVERMQLAKKIAADAGNPNLKTFGLFTLVPAASDQEADDRVAYFNEGTDTAAFESLLAYYTDPENEARKHWERQIAQRQSLMDGYMAGSYDTLARRLATAVQQGDLDGIMLVVPDFIEDLEIVAREVFPRLTDFGITSNIVQATRTG